MKKLIPICVSAMLLSAPIFAQTPGTGAGSTMSQPSGSASSPSSSGSMNSPSSDSSSSKKQQKMEDNTMSPDAATSPSSGMGTGTQMNPDKSDKEDDSSY